MAKKKKSSPSELLLDAIVEGMQNNKAQEKVYRLISEMIAANN